MMVQMIQMKIFQIKEKNNKVTMIHSSKKMKLNKKNKLFPNQERDKESKRVKQ